MYWGENRNRIKMMAILSLQHNGTGYTETLKEQCHGVVV
jgi:hypothetical protein